MVLINCSKFISFLRCIYNCPADVPGRHEALYQAYLSLEQTSSQVLSIRVRPDNDRVIQKNIDEEDNETRKQNIIKDIVDIYTPNNVDFTDLSTIFLIPSLELCSLCDNMLNISRPSRRGRNNVVVYTTDGPRKCVTSNALRVIVLYITIIMNGQIKVRLIDVTMMQIKSTLLLHKTLSLA